MSAVSGLITNTGRIGKLPFIVVVLVPYVHLFIFFPGSLTLSELFTLVSLGLVYTAAGVLGPAYLGRLGSSIAPVAYFAFQIPLGTWIQFLSHNSGAFWLILLPLASQSLYWFARNGIVAVCSLIVVALMLAIGLQRDWVEELQSAFLYLSAVVFVVILTMEMVRERDARTEMGRLAEHLSEANRKLREYAGQVEEPATAKERNRLAHNIHDCFGRYLSAIGVQVSVAEAGLEGDHRRAREALRSAQKLAQDGLEEMRRSVAALRAIPPEDRPLREAVAELAIECRAAGVAAELAVHGVPRSLAPQAELTIFRAAQEGLTNVRKHAHASRVDLTLDYRQRRRVRLAVQDNGVGAAPSAGGFGLLGIRERAQLLGGEFRTGTAFGEGFTLEVEVPG